MSFLNHQASIKIYKVLIVVLAVHAVSFAAFAQQKSPTQSNSTVAVGGSSTTTVTTSAKEKSRFGLSLGIEYSERIAEEELGSRENGTDITIAPSFKINDLLTTSARAAVSKSNNSAGDTTVSDTQIGLSIKGIKLSEKLMTSHSISAVIPTSETSKERDRLQTALGVTNGIKWSSEIVQLGYKLGLSKNVHEFTVNADGSANVEYRVANMFDAQINITEKIYLTALGVYRLGRTYGGKERTAFEAHTDINWDASDKLTLNLGTSNVGSALKANGVDSNISAFDEDTSVVRAGISLSL